MFFIWRFLPWGKLRCRFILHYSKTGKGLGGFAACLEMPLLGEKMQCTCSSWCIQLQVQTHLCPSAMSPPLAEHPDYLLLFFSHSVFHRTEKAVLPDCQDMSHPDQSDDPTTSGSCHQGYASLQESRACHRSGQTLPEPWAEQGVQRG